MHVLQSVQWPSASAMGASEHLYFRAEPRTAWEMQSAGGIRTPAVPPGGELKLDLSTFFGAFSLSTWCGAAGLGSVVVEVEFRGRAFLQIYEDNGYEGRTLILQRRIVGDGRRQAIEVPGLKGRRGMLFPVFILGGGDELELAALRYCTREPPRYAPRLAIVMPTYKRERFVAQNIARISAGVLADHPECRLLVIDNGSSLELSSQPGVELIRNPNYGGAGGFARGLLELERAAEPYSHVLFCDDDVLVNPQAIVRLLALLCYTDARTVVAGSMLKMGAKHVHVKSANVVGMRFSGYQRDKDLTQTIAVARHDEPGFATFSGWWFVCYPLAGGIERFMPAPYFVGWDDVEMGRRCNKLGLRTVSLLGIAIWHDDFEKKEANWRWYYHARNGVVTAMFYEPGRLALRHITGEIFWSLLTYRYDRAQMMLEGLDAVVAGPQALRALRADEFHRDMLARPQVQFGDVSAVMVPDKLREGNPRKRAIMARLTLNGHLLPPWFFKSAREPSFPGWIVEHLHSHVLVRIFRSRRVVYYEPTSGKGMLCEVSHPRFFRLLLRLLGRWLVLRLRWRSVRDTWRAEHARLTSPEFWREYLGLPKA